MKPFLTTIGLSLVIALNAPLLGCTGKDPAGADGGASGSGAEGHQSGTDDTPSDGADSAGDRTGTDGEGSGTDPLDSLADGGSEVCDAQRFEISQLPVSMMILQDVSTSMEEPEDAPVNKWEQAREALKLLLAEWQGSNITFGFDAFPDGSQDVDDPLVQCGVEADLLFDCVPGNEDEIMSALDRMSPLGATPLWCELNHFLGDTYAPRFAKEAQGERYLLVVSDGEDTCGKDCEYLPRATVNALEDLVTALLTEKGIRTIAVGFGEELEGAERQLTAIASSGGSPFTGFLRAENQDELYAAFSLIAGEVFSCTFRIQDPKASADPDKVNLYFDGELLGYDENCQSGVGWRWSDDTHTALALCPEACERLKNKEVNTVTAEFGCKTETVPMV